MNTFVRNHKFLTLVGVVAAGSSTLLLKKENRIAFHETWNGAKRGFKLTRTVLGIALDYKWSFRGLDMGTQAFKDVEKVVDQRSADKTLKLFLDLGGIFTKAGQVISSVRMLPPEWVNTLSKCQDSANPVPFDDVSRVFKEDLGIEAKDIFSEIDQDPIGSASLAQVHHAVLKSGEEVAVKIQYPHVRRELKYDLQSIELLAKLIGFMFKGFRYGFMVDMLKRELDREVNFSLEANNCINARNFFSSFKDIYVPKVFEEFTSERVLVMEYINGCKITETEKIEDMGFSMKNVLDSFLNAFGNYLFVYGDLHVDPHPGNILVRPSPSNPKAHQVVIIDHGMYYKVKDEYRVHFCNLWQAIVLRDKQRVKEECEKMDIGPFAKIIPFMLMGQSIDSKKKVGEVITKEELQEIHEKHKNMKRPPMDLAKMSEVMEKMPDDFKFIMRTLQIVTAVYLGNGGTNSNRLYMLTDCSQKGLDAVNCTDGQLSFTERVAYQYHLLKLHVRLMYFDIYLPLMNVLIPLYIQFMNYWYPNEKSEEPQKPQDTKKTDLKY